MGTHRKSALLFGLVAATMVPAVTQAQQGGSSTGHKIAIVDVAHIFKEHPAIKSQVERVETDLKSYDEQLSKKRDNLKLQVEQLKQFKVGTPDYTAQEEQIAAEESRLRLEMARKRKELADAEARIYYENYQKIAAAVKLIAEHNGIQMVLRHNSETMSLEQEESVIRGVMKNIVYHHQDLDLTPLVMNYLTRELGNGTQTATAPARGAAPQQR